VSNRLRGCSPRLNFNVVDYSSLGDGGGDESEGGSLSFGFDGRLWAKSASETRLLETESDSFCDYEEM
jgi:hypothetical protein